VGHQGGLGAAHVHALRARVARVGLLHHQRDRHGLSGLAVSARGRGGGGRRGCGRAHLARAGGGVRQGRAQGWGRPDLPWCQASEACFSVCKPIAGLEPACRPLYSEYQ